MDPVKDTIFPLMELPEELIVKVLYHSSIRDLCRIEQCSENLKRIVTDAYKNRINEFLACINDSQISDIQKLGGKVIKKFKEMGRNVAIEYEKTGFIGGKHVRPFYSLKDLFMDSVVHENLCVDSIPLNLKCKMSRLFLEMQQVYNSDKIKNSVTPPDYMKVLRSEEQSKKKANTTLTRQITPLDAYREFAKIDIALPIGREEAEARLKKVGQENVVVYRISSRPGEMCISSFKGGRTEHEIVPNDVRSPSYSKFYEVAFTIAFVQKFLVEAEKEMKIDPTESKQKITFTEHQTLCAKLDLEIKSLPIYIKEMSRKDAENCLREGQYCIRNSSSINVHGNSEFALSYKLSDGDIIHHLIFVDDYGRLIINEIPYSSVQEFLTKGKDNGFLQSPYLATQHSLNYVAMGS
jgi:hypothetical protein